MCRAARSGVKRLCVKNEWAPSQTTTLSDPRPTAMPHLHLDFALPLSLARVTAAVRDSAARPHPPGAPPRRAPSARAADAVASLLGGAGVGVPAAWDTVHVYCCKVGWVGVAEAGEGGGGGGGCARHPPTLHPHTHPQKLQANLATVYKTLVTRGELAGVAVGPVAESVCLDPPRGEEAMALAAAAGAALRASGWRRIMDNMYINADWATLEGPTSVAIAALGADSEVAPPASARLAIRVSPSRVAPFTPDATLEAAGKLRPSGSAPADARALSDALFGCVAVPLPSLEEATIVGVTPAWQGDAALLAEWRDAVGRPDLPAPHLWVQCVPGDDDCDAAAAASVSGEGLFVALVSAAATCAYVHASRGGQGAAAPARAGASCGRCRSSRSAALCCRVWGAAPRVVGVAYRVPAPAAASTWGRPRGRVGGPPPRSRGV